MIFDKDMRMLLRVALYPFFAGREGEKREMMNDE
jgi:hypothetical protein